MIPTAFDLSKLESNSNCYVAVRFAIPYCLHLPDANYKAAIEINSRTLIVQIVLTKVYSNLSRRSVLPGASSVERFAGRRGDYSYSSAIAYIPFELEKQNLSFDKVWGTVEKNHSAYRQQAITALNELIKIYRFCTGECHIRPLTGHDVWFDYNIAFIPMKQLGDASVISVDDLNDIVATIPDFPYEVVTDIQDKTLSGFQVPLSTELLLNAYDFLDQGNYRLSVIEAETAFETAVLTFLHNYYHDQPNSISKIESYQSFGQIINDPLFNNALASRAKKFIKNESPRKEWNESVWQLRGDLVHGRKLAITFPEALKATQTVESTLEDLLDRPPIRPWRYSGGK
jgi:hypothetical protein